MSNFNDPDYNERIGRRIREIRKSLKMSQTELGNAIGYAGKASISSIERGKNRITTGTLQKIAKALGVKPSDLLPTDRKTIETIDAIQKTKTSYTVELDRIFTDAKQTEIAPDDLKILRAVIQVLQSGDEELKNHIDRLIRAPADKRAKIIEYAELLINKKA